MSPPQRRKRLEGVTGTPTLWSLYDESLAVIQEGGKKTPTKPLLTSISTEDSEATTKTTGTTTTNALLINAPSLEEARTIITTFQKEKDQKQQKRGRSNNKDTRPKVLPISLIRSIQVVLSSTSSDSTSWTQKLEGALGETQLSFSIDSTAENDDTNNAKEKKKFRERMERLRLQNEESKYYKITKNIGNNPMKDDDITTKSMTYAASVGLNMIVAPISFGVFMYFFSGPILNFLWSNYQPPNMMSNPGAVDIRKVIIGVVSGVAMLFIEMLLFVIRTHELERGMKKKQKKMNHQMGTSHSKYKPFGEYSSKSIKNYKSE